MAFKPCFSVNLQKGVKVLAGVDIFFSIVAIIGSVYVICCVLSVTNFADSSSYSDKNEPMGVGRALLALLTLPFSVIGQVLVAVVLIVAAGVLCYATIQLILAAILFSGANQRNHGRCMIWFVVTIIFTIITAVICCASLASDDDAKITAFCFNFIRLVFAIYEIVVVGYFLKELKSENPTANSDDDVKECDSTSQEPGIELSDLSQCPPPDYSSIAQTATAPKKAEMDHYSDQ